MKRFFCGKLLIILLLVGLVACGNNEGSGTAGEDTKSAAGGEQITLWVPFSGPDGPKMQEIVNAFNDSQDEFSVNYQVVPQSEYYTTIDLTLNDNRNVPDLMVMHGNQILTYVENDLLKNLDDITGETVNLEDYNENAVEGAMVDGELYGIPLDIHPLMFYWNKDLFEAAGLDPDVPPTNREEFVEFAQKLTDGNGQYGYVVPTLWPQQFIMPTIVYQNGGKLFDEGQVLYDSEEVVEALEFQRSLITEYGVSPSDVQQDGEVTLFLQGKNAMHMNGPWMLQQWEDSGMNFGVAPVPMLGTKQQAVFGNSHNFVVPEVVGEEKHEAIKQFLSFTAENGMAWAESGQAPASKAVYESAEFQEMKQQPEVAKQFDYTQFSPRVRNWGQLSDPLMEAVNEVLLGQKEPREALEEATNRAQQRLN
ncbi:ABC transporter substrate-binding protein [Halalkalibacter alkaliphilus]|uniref:ABC transporter substrate-binding protein n=1 Tax=Halalkalibacter alkaliphilus TaxID=2917993 RepID=A0A9X2A4P1_9BACI|nr:ABC transporter substrate-binding protein [Halalkalibacter alkaliphilus]MCL7746813.1 ABC transporter substrate-binding protein [Halalkalibacter alkaliphilus]